MKETITLQIGTQKQTFKVHNRTNSDVHGYYIYGICETNPAHNGFFTKKFIEENKV